MSKEELLNEFISVLSNNENDENSIQDFLENNTELIVTPFLLNHGLHFEAVISKFKISEGNISDYAYLTKSSDYWFFVLVELEDPKKRLFTSNKESIQFHHEFNNAYDQVLSWKASIENNNTDVLNRIKALKVPLHENPIRFKYVLVIGRNEEKNNSKRKSNLFAQKNTDDIRVMTYDSLISDYMNSKERTREKVVLTHWRHGFAVKSVPKNTSTSIFAYCKPENIKVVNDVREKLMRQGFDMQAWEDGNLLLFNGKNIFSLNTELPEGVSKAPDARRTGG